MKLAELLQYDDITIQCHDDPDADAIACGWTLLTYLESKGKTPRLVYTGSRKVRKVNLLLMLDKFNIPLKYLPEPDGTPELLVTVDGQAGEGNMSPLPYRNLAVIDHHEVEDESALPALNEVRSGCGSCSTVLWSMLLDAGFAPDVHLSTALYYGLYMDTNGFRGMSDPLDRDMLDTLRIDGSVLSQLKSANLSAEELGIVGKALANLHRNLEFRFAVAQVQPCDPNILGVVSDQVMTVDQVDVCVSYCLLSDHVKISVRSYLEKIQADKLARWIAHGFLNDAGGDRMKAGGRLPLNLVRQVCCDVADTGWDGLEGAVGRLIYRRIASYFEDEIQYRAGEYQPDGTEVLYRKKKIPSGYVPSDLLFPVGTEILIRMIEGDTIQKVSPEIYIRIGVSGETYLNKKDDLLRDYELLDEPYEIEGLYPPVVYQAATHEKKSLEKYARQCIAKDEAQIWARQLDRRAEVTTEWGRMLGEAGDWLASKASNPQDIYIIRKEIFEKTYERAR